MDILSKMDTILKKKQDSTRTIDLSGSFKPGDGLSIHMNTAHILSGKIASGSTYKGKRKMGKVHGHMNERAHIS